MQSGGDLRRGETDSTAKARSAVLLKIDELVQRKEHKHSHGQAQQGGNEEETNSQT
jgi:hypothetical protein